MKVFLVGLLLVGGCAHQTPEQREAERLKRERCARVEMYPEGVTPPQQYRVIGPVSAYNEGNPAMRERKLQQQACDIGADAVVEVRSEVAQRNVLVGPSYIYESVVSLSGTAVAYVTDAPPPTPPPTQ
jgi:hypothetical protein